MEQTLLDLRSVDLREVPGLPAQLGQAASIWLSLNEIRLTSSGCEADHHPFSLKAGEAGLDLSWRCLGPKDLAVVAAVFNCLPQFTAVLTEVNLAGNVCFGTRQKYCGKLGGHNLLHDDDADQSGFAVLCDALKPTAIASLDLEDVGMGPLGLAKLATIFAARARPTGLNSLCANGMISACATVCVCVWGGERVASQPGIAS